MRRGAALLLGLSAACSTAVPERPAAPAAKVQSVHITPAVAQRANGVRGAPLACEPARQLPAIDQPALEVPRGPSEVNLRAWVATLAGLELRGREAGTDDALRAAAAIAERFSALGIETPNAAGYCQPFSGEGFRDQNVIAHLAPDQPACPWVVLGAHYDALGVDRRGRVFPGADDNASGVALLLEAARLLVARQARAKVGVVFAAFGGEEKDLAGSRAYVNAPTLPLGRVALMINVDMVGKRPAGHPGIGYQPSGPGRSQTDRSVKRAAGRAGVGVIPMNLGDRSDSASFAPHVPTVFFSTAVSADYHQPTDRADRVDYGQVRRALSLVLELIQGLTCDG